MQEIMKNIRKAEALKLKDELQYQEGQVVSKTLIQNEAVSITLFSFAKGEEISPHESGRRCVGAVPGRQKGLLRLTETRMYCERGNPLSCPPATRTPCLPRNRLKMLLVVAFVHS